MLFSTTFLLLLDVASTAFAAGFTTSNNHSPQWHPPYGSSPPTRLIAGVTVLDTPVVRAAHSTARQYSTDFVYNHVMRGWLYGALIVSHNTTLQATVDLEVQAVAALLHDIGWDQTPNSPYVSHDKRFEIDGAIAARDFLDTFSSNSSNNRQGGSPWNERRVQLVFDSIALHTQASIYNYKEREVRTTGNGIQMDFAGMPLASAHGITEGELKAVIDAFPMDGMISGLNDTMLWLCGTKPATTYDTWMQPWGEHYVPGYSAENNTALSMFKNLAPPS